MQIITIMKIYTNVGKHLFIVWLSLSDFRCLISNCAFDSHQSLVCEMACESIVRQLDVDDFVDVLTPNQHVLRFHIFIDQLVGMQVLQCTRDLYESDGFYKVQCSDVLNIHWHLKYKCVFRLKFLKIAGTYLALANWMVQLKQASRKYYLDLNDEELHSFAFVATSTDGEIDKQMTNLINKLVDQKFIHHHHSVVTGRHL